MKGRKEGVQNSLGLDLATWTIDWAGLMVSSKQAHPRNEATEVEEQVAALHYGHVSIVTWDCHPEVWPT